MIRTFRVTLSGLKGFLRVYKVNSDSTLYRFHKQMVVDMEFPQDQPMLFKGLSENGSVVARYALVDLGNGAVDDVTVEKAIKDGVVSFVYFYDTLNKKSVILTLDGDAEPGSVSAPTIVESKGPVPFEFENGYVAFEDLPKDKRKLPGEDDDEDFDDDDDAPSDEEDDETEEIVDESELD